MTRQVLVFIGVALLSFGGAGIIIGLGWLTASHVHGSLPYIFGERAEALVYMLPALLLVIALLGAGFIAAALSTPTKEERTRRTLRTHTRFHV
jgi:hypothetical protein